MFWNISKKLKLTFLDLADSYNLLFALRKNAISTSLKEKPITLSIIYATQFALSVSLTKNIPLFPLVPVERPTETLFIMGEKSLDTSDFSAISDACL